MLPLSIIIPTLNEARDLPVAVATARSRACVPPCEILVADCGSRDGTAELAATLGVRLVTSQPPLASRAAALNRGAAAARGEVLLFLDADTLVPPNFDSAIARALCDPGVVGGAFEFALDGRGWALRLVEVLNRIRYRLWPRYYGDQGIFVRAHVFRRAGGYPERRILEASDFSRILARHGKLVLLRQRMCTSSRRFEKGGALRVLAHDVRIWWRDLLGLPTEAFAEAYQEYNRQRGVS